ncbi:MAG: hypothetical protein GY868_00855 [Deltaproteobacteria bacterium]|nr:hypothetical protein [Deltaproteobacteria bacterium]
MLKYLLYVVCLTAATAAAADAGDKRILLVHSYHAEYAWVDDITCGVRKAFADQPVVLDIVYMDTKRNTSLEWKLAAGKRVRDIIEASQPDAVIAADDNAQIYVTRHYLNKRPWFVFCGVNAEPAEYGFPASNITGIIERPHFVQSLKLLKQIFPQAKKIAVISDIGPTSIGALNFMRKADIDLKVVDYRLIGDYELWQKRVRQYCSESDALCIYTYHTLKASKGATAYTDSGKIMQWTVEQCRIPTVGFFEFSINDGMLCGVVESGEEHGYEAALMALKLVAGNDIKQVPIKRAIKGSAIINLKTAERNGVFISNQIIKAADDLVQ